MKKVIKFILILVLICFSFCGCVIKKKQIKTQSCFNSLSCKIKIVVVDHVFKKIKLAAQEFEKKDKSLKFEIVKIKDDEKFRKNTLEQILNKKANVFFVHGEKDVF